MRAMVKAVLLSGLVAAFVMPAFAAGETNSVRIDEAVALYRSRHLEPANTAKSERLLSAVLQEEPSNVHALYELSRVYYIQGNEANGKDAKLALYNKGSECAKKAFTIDGRCVWGHVWYAVNLGKIGQARGVLNSLFLVDDIKAALEKALAIDPANVVALNVRAAVNAEVPRMLGGSVPEAIKDLEKALAIDPNYTILYAELGKIYIKKKDYARARQYLARGLATAKPTYEADFILVDKPRLLELLGSIERK